MDGGAWRSGLRTGGTGSRPCEWRVIRLQVAQKSGEHCGPEPRAILGSGARVPREGDLWASDGWSSWGTCPG